jgi:hypothetical protein
MERFRWQRSRLRVRHATLPTLGALIYALLLIFLKNQFRESKQNPQTSDRIRDKAPFTYEIIGVCL